MRAAAGYSSGEGPLCQRICVSALTNRVCVAFTLCPFFTGQYRYMLWLYANVTLCTLYGFYQRGAQRDQYTGRHGGHQR